MKRENQVIVNAIVDVYNPKLSNQENFQNLVNFLREEEAKSHGILSFYDEIATFSYDANHFVINLSRDFGEDRMNLGYDRPMKTFFWSCFEDDEEIFWIGTVPHEAPTFEDFMQEVYVRDLAKY